MAHSLSAKKRIRQNLKRREQNVTRKSALKTQIRKFLDALQANDLDAAREQFVLTTKKLDQVAAKGTIHQNAAARKKARLQKRFNALKANAAS